MYMLYLLCTGGGYLLLHLGDTTKTSKVQNQGFIVSLELTKFKFYADKNENYQKLYNNDCITCTFSSVART